jgi:hypothetical protein
MAVVELVFRTVGERTSAASLDLAIRQIRPSRVHVIENVMPFRAAVDAQLALQHECDQVVYVDADCLILEDMRPFIDRNPLAYVDCYVTDRFRGRLHCGVHITRIDVVEQMRRMKPSEDDLAYVLRPESRLRNLAMSHLGLDKEFRNFDILHDYFQYRRDIVAKYALRELRSRSPMQRQRLEMSMADWPAEDDFATARIGVEMARAQLPVDATPREVHTFIESLPTRSAAELARRGVSEKGEFELSELEASLKPNKNVPGRKRQHEQGRIFGLGLSRTGTRSLTSALHILGFNVTHYPIDRRTFDQLAAADYKLDILEVFDGLTDITAAPFYAQLDHEYPGSKFILTTRETQSWLRSCARHWAGRPAFGPEETDAQQAHMLIRRLLRSATYGCYDYNAERFAWVYEQHVRNVRAYFADRPDDLLELDVTSGAGWGPLCEFLGCAVPQQPFPHKGASSEAKMHENDMID